MNRASRDPSKRFCAGILRDCKRARPQRHLGAAVELAARELQPLGIDSICMARPHSVKSIYHWWLAGFIRSRELARFCFAIRTGLTGKYSGRARACWLAPTPDN